MGKATAPTRYRVTKEAAQHSEVERHNGIDRVTGHAPVDRWRRDGVLSPSQEAAIAYCERIWALVGTEQRTVASYDERLDRSADGESGRMLLRRMDAADDLRRIAGGICGNGQWRPGYIPSAYWKVFENCVRFGEPAGVLGSSLGRLHPHVRAQVTVQFVADLIAMNEGLTS